MTQAETADLTGRLASYERMLAFLMASHLLPLSDEHRDGVIKSFKDHKPPLGAGLMDVESLEAIWQSSEATDARVFQAANGLIDLLQSPTE